MSDDLAELCSRIRKRMARGQVIPFLGAGASLAGRPEGPWQPKLFPPKSDELAEYLAEEHSYPRREQNRSLVRVAQFADLMTGDGALYFDLRDLFNGAYKPNVVHEYLATQPKLQRDAGLPNPWPLIVTTNYDDLLERAFDAADEPYDLVSYFAEPRRRGTFRHRPPGGVTTPMRRPRDQGFALGERTVIVKLHGAIDPHDEGADTFVITEDHYIAYMADDVARRLPASLLATMRDCHFLFLGYSLEDWNLRVILFRIWAQRRHTKRSWSVLLRTNDYDRTFWANHGVRVVETRLEQWVERMRMDSA